MSRVTGHRYVGSSSYSREGLQHAEVAALRIFSDADAADPDVVPPEQNLIIDPFQRFIGEVFVRNFEGRWLWADAYDSSGPEPVVEVPYSSAPMVVRVTLIRVVDRRRGNELAWVFDRQQESYRLWVTAGRPSYPEFAELRDQLDDEGDRAQGSGASRSARTRSA